MAWDWAHPIDSLEKATNGGQSRGGFLWHPLDTASGWIDKGERALGVNTPYQAPTNLTQTDYSGTIGQTTADQFAARRRQNALADMLLAQAQGRGPTLAQMQLQRGMEQGEKMAAGAIGGMRGMNPALQARMILGNEANANQEMAGQAAMLRAQEQLAAEGQLGGVLGGMRGQDIGMFGHAGTLQGQQNTTNLQENMNRNAAAMANAAGRRELTGNIINGVASMAGHGGVGGGGGTQYFPSATSFGAGAGNDATDTSGGGNAAHGGAVMRFGVRAPSLADHLMTHGGIADDPRNDIVPAMLSPGEIVLPRSVSQAEDAPEKAAAFVDAIRRQKTPQGGSAGMLATIRDLSERIKRLEGGKPA